MERSSKPLHQAIWSSNTIKIKYYLKEDEEVNEKDENGLRPLDIAVITNNLEAAKLLMTAKEVTVDFAVIYYLTQVQNDEMIPLLFDDRIFSETKSSEGDNLLHLAITQGYEKMAYRLLTNYDHKVSVYDTTRNGFTPLDLAIIHNRPNIFWFLLNNRKTDFAKRTFDGRSVIHLAVEQDQENFLIMLLEKGASANDIVTSTGSSALHIAAKKNNADIVNILLANDADLMCKDGRGWTVLHVAAYHGYTKLVKLFLEKGIDINILTNDDSSPLLLAIGNNCEDATQTLLDDGADVNIRNRSGLNPLCASIKNKNVKLTKTLHSLGGKIHDLVEENQSLLHVSLRYGDLDFAKLLLQKRIKINTRNRLGQSELHAAAQYGNADIVQRILKRGLDVNDLTFDRSTALHYALHSKENTEVLIKHGIKIDAENEDGDTALNIGAKTSCDDSAFEHLLKSGANPNHLPKDKISPLQSAISKSGGYLEKARLLAKYGANLNRINEKGDSCIHAILKLGEGCGCTIAGRIDEFLKLGTDVNVVNHDGETALITLLELSERNYTYCNLAETLMDKGAKITTNKMGESLLHIAIRSGSVGHAKFFIEKNVDIQCTTPNGSNPLHYAAQFGNAEIMRLLLDAGMEVNNTNNDRKTPLHLAASHGPIEAVQALIERDADISKKDNDWNTPLHLAVSRGSLDIVKLLVKNGAFSCQNNLKGFTVYDLADQIENKHIYQCLLLS